MSMASFATISRGGGSDVPGTPPSGRTMKSNRGTSSPSLVSVLGTRHDSASPLRLPSRRLLMGNKGNYEASSCIFHRSKTPSKKVSESGVNRKLPLPPAPTPIKIRNSRIEKGLSTPPRRTMEASPVGSPSVLRTPLRNCRTISNQKRARIRQHSSPCLQAPSSSNSDRFIPNRQYMDMEICRANVISAEKQRVAAIEKKAEQLRLGENGDPNSQSPPSRGETLTPLQSEFRRRMRGALLNVPLEEVGSRQRVRQNGGNSNEESVSTHSSLEGSVRDDLSNLAYAALPDEDEHSGIPDELAASNSSHSSSLGSTRMLSFQSSTVVGNTSLMSDTSVQTSGPLADVTTTATSSTASTSWASPFEHDQLRVLYRSASSPGDTSMDPMSLADAGLRSVAQTVGRRINAAPTRILDAPELVDDYYLNLVSWGADNILAVALGQCVYLWDADTGSIQHLLTLHDPDDYVTSVSWATYEGHTNYIAVGTNESAVQLWDAEALRNVRTLGGHSARVGSLAWNRNWLSSGGRDSLILQHDVRAPNHIVSKYTGHTQEVCGLRWNDDGTTLASGGNENMLCLWDAAMSQRASNRRNALRENSNIVNPRLVLTQHQAAVKALAWCPFHRGLLASGGGTADRTIKFWNTNSGALLNSIDTGSQVCSLLWSKHQKEICSSHGFSENQLILWKYPTMKKIQEFKGHTARVLHMEQSPDGACVVSAAADETLRFWDVFGTPPSQGGKTNSFAAGAFSGRMMSIR